MEPSTRGEERQRRALQTRLLNLLIEDAKNNKEREKEKAACSAEKARTTHEPPA